ncbi:hypothetical protein Ddc_19938 [Ditylenchus destructor]|nr:hypothetical protein Ddc_19938 [Ditylenchus destructor]
MVFAKVVERDNKRDNSSDNSSSIFSNHSSNISSNNWCLCALLALFCLVLLWNALSSSSSSLAQTQALGAKAAATLKSTATESLAKIFSAANGQSENYYIVSYATSKIEAVKKDGLAAIDSAVATAKAAYEAAGADRTAAHANAVTAIDAALSAAVIAINAVTDSAISVIHPIELWSNNSTAYTITNKSVVMFMFVLLITTKMFSSPGMFTVWYVMK